MTTPDIAHLRELMERATQGPLFLGLDCDPPPKYASHYEVATFHHSDAPVRVYAKEYTKRDSRVYENAELFVTMRNAMPELLAHIQRLEAVAKAARVQHDALEKWSVECPAYVADAVCDLHHAISNLDAAKPCQ